MFSSSFSAPCLSAFYSCPHKCQERAGFKFVRWRAVNSEPALIGYLSFRAKMEGERPGSLAAKYCSIVLCFISAGRSDQKLCGNAR